MGSPSTWDADTREARKFLEGLRLTETSQLEGAAQAFKSAGSLTGEALVAFHQRKPERAANKALKALRKAIAGDTDAEDPRLAYWVLKRSRERLPERDIPPHLVDREERVAAEADDFLSSIGRTEWGVIRAHLRPLAESFPAAIGRLVEARTSKALETRMTVAAFMTLIHEGDLHAARDLFDAGDRARTDSRMFPVASICPGCIPHELAPDARAPDDPWWMRRRFIDELKKLGPESPTSREEAYIFAVAATQLAPHLRKLQLGDPERLLTLAEQWLDRLGTLPTLRRSRLHLSEATLRGAEIALRAGVAVRRRQFDRARELWAEAVRTGDPVWSEVARKSRELLDEDQQRTGERDRATSLFVQWQAADEAGDEPGQLGILEALAPIEALLGRDSEQLAHRRTFLRAVLGRPTTPEDLALLAGGWESDPRLRAALWEAARAWAAEGKARASLRLLRRTGPTPEWSTEELREFLSWCEKTECTSLAARTLTVLAGKECAAIPEAARALIRVNARVRAALLLTADARSPCRDPDHRWRAWTVAQESFGPDVMEATARAFIEAARDDPRARAALARVESDAARRLQAHVREASQAAIEAARGGSWARVEGALTGIDPHLLGPEAVEALARAKAELGHPREAAQTQLMLGHDPESLLKAAAWLLQAREPALALEALGPLGEEMEEGARPEWLARLTASAPPDLCAVALAAVGQLRGSALRALDPSLLRLVASEARRQADEVAEGIALSRVAGLVPLDDEERARLPALRAALPLGLKARAGPPFEGERGLVLLDTNVLIDLVLHDVGEEIGCGLRLRGEVVDRVMRMKEGPVTLVVAGVTANEFLSRVGAPPDPDAEEVEIDKLVTAAERLVEGLGLKRFVGEEVRPGEEHRERAEAFFRKHRVRLEELTESKARKDPARAEEIRRKRRGAHAEGADGPALALPERGDIWLLAQALRLQEVRAPGISSVAILSDDRDFRDLRDAIREALGIEVV